jgi:hypothetical protein
MALNNDPNFPPGGNAPYKINREWCVGDSLGYINANSENFDTRLGVLEGITNINNISSPLYTINNKLSSAPLFQPVGFLTENNSNVQLVSQTLNSTTAQYSGSIKKWYSPNIVVNVPSKPTNTVGILANVMFYANTRGNNVVEFLLKNKDASINNSTYPTITQLNNYSVKFSMDPTAPGADWEAQQNVTMIIYLDSVTEPNPLTFSWRISDTKANNPWATNTKYKITIDLLGYYIVY